MQLDSPHVLTPSERLAASRRALVAQWHGQTNDDDFEYEPQPQPRPLGGFDAALWAPVARRVVKRWWQRHPANAISHLAVPAIERYARKEPAKLIAGAAAVGAVIVLVRPWRLLSITAVLAALLKTSEVAGVVTTLMQRDTPPRKDE